MFRSFLRTTWRNLKKDRVHSLINVSGLAVGMAVVMLISLWIWDECNFNSYHENHGRIAQVMQNAVSNGFVNTYNTMPIPLESVLRSNYGNQFKYIVLAAQDQHSVSYGDKSLALVGSYIQPAGPEMLTLKMVSGARAGLNGPSSILLAASMAKALFGNADPIGKTLKLDSKLPVSVTGVYEDLPYNSSFNGNLFFAPWSLFVSSDSAVSHSQADWGNSSYMMYVQLADNSNISDVSARIKNADVRNQASADPREGYFLYPMDRWHLYSEFQNGRNVGGRVLYVWLFGIIGAFVLFLACINFMNLSTARSEKRAKEIGVRKVLGASVFIIWRLLSMEFVALASIGLVLAIPLAYYIMYNWLKNYQYRSTIPFWVFAVTGIGIILLTLLTVSYRAIKAALTNPVSTLRSE